MSDFHDMRDRRRTDGHWVVNPGTGVVIGRNNRPIGQLTYHGYMAADRGDKRVFLHRVVWESVNGPIPAGLFINHINGVKTDNRIANLELVTHQENVAHRDRLGLRKAPKGMESHQSKMTDDDVRLIRTLRKCGLGKDRIAKIIGINRSTVGNVIHRGAWKHVI